MSFKTTRFLVQFVSQVYIYIYIKKAHNHIPLYTYKSLSNTSAISVENRQKPLGSSGKKPAQWFLQAKVYKDLWMFDPSSYDEVILPEPASHSWVTTPIISLLTVRLQPFSAVFIRHGRPT